MKSFYIKTLGCKVNQYEAQVIRENFIRQGYVESEDLDKADICVVNTCTVTSTSDSKSFRLVHNALKKDKCVVVTGCLVEDKDLDLSRLRGVGYIVRNRDKHRIPEIIEPSAIPPKALGFAERRARPRQLLLAGSLSAKISGLKGHTRVFVKIQDGCNNRCSYCKVRVVRGRSRSRPFKEIISECKDLIKSGTKEIVLTGICLGAYGRDVSKDMDLSKLVAELCKIQGQWRLRLSSIEPKDVTTDLIAQLKKQKKLCRHLHIPFQSGDDYILKRMRRPYKRQDYLDIVHRLKQVDPDIAISTDIMVGFPGETEERFQNTVDFINVVMPMRVHIFPFSKRKGTPAYDYKDDIDILVKRDRENRLTAVTKELTQEFVNKFIGKDVEVLVESKKTKDGHLQGYTDRYIKVYIEGPDTLIGKLIQRDLSFSAGWVGHS
ncbi:MAG: tRNA (N(6)-L-threonylcarbamoyladenosine(37)-C(2))-methylthiotransferase MtaB [Candidatus Omnitrophica bacterium]|nr:tRNA (N(6)-L-threonylcarbamoyladenosine(37)-C(2))-methylthiotransferase MtaB [Candidatus Omnitrophota bacterium]